MFELMLVVALLPLHAADSDYGLVSPRAPVETARFDVLKGKWDLWVRIKTGPFSYSRYKATFTCSWVADGMVFQQYWEGPYVTGREYRFYNEEAGHWVGYNHYNGGGLVATVGFFEDNQIIILAETEDESGPVINRETYYNIDENSWEMKAERSYDNGLTWVEGSYSIRAARLE